MKPGRLLHFASIKKQKDFPKKKKRSCFCLVFPLALGLLLLDRRPGGGFVVVAVEVLVALALQTLHLAGLQLAQVELAQVDAAELVAHGVGRDVLLGALLGAPGLAHGLLEHGLVRVLDAAEAEVHPGAVLLDLDAGQLLAGPLGPDQVGAQVQDGLGARVVGGLGARGLVGRDDHAVLQALDVDLVGRLAAEEVDQH